MLGSLFSLIWVKLYYFCTREHLIVSIAGLHTIHAYTKLVKIHWYLLKLSSENENNNGWTSGHTTNGWAPRQPMTIMLPSPSDYCVAGYSTWLMRCRGAQICKYYNLWVVCFCMWRIITQRCTIWQVKQCSFNQFRSYGLDTHYKWMK